MDSRGPGRPPGLEEPHLHSPARSLGAWPPRRSGGGGGRGGNVRQQGACPQAQGAASPPAPCGASQAASPSSGHPTPCPSVSALRDAFAEGDGPQWYLQRTRPTLRKALLLLQGWGGCRGSVVRVPGSCPQGHCGSGRGLQGKVQASALWTSEGSGKAAGLDVGRVPSPGEQAGQHGVRGPAPWALTKGTPGSLKRVLSVASNGVEETALGGC